MIHEARDRWHIRVNCPCGQSKIDPSSYTPPVKNGVTQHLLNAVSQCITSEENDVGPIIAADTNHKSGKTMAFVENNINGSPRAMSPLSMLAEAAVSRESVQENRDSVKGAGGRRNKSDQQQQDGGKTTNCSTLRDLLTRRGVTEDKKKSAAMHSTLIDIIQKGFERSHPPDDTTPVKRVQLLHYIPKTGVILKERDTPIPRYTLTETSLLYPDVPHSWLDHGHLLRLHDPRARNNIKLFQQQWRRAQVCHATVNVNQMPNTIVNSHWQFLSPLLIAGLLTTVLVISSRTLCISPSGVVSIGICNSSCVCVHACVRACACVCVSVSIMN